MAPVAPPHWTAEAARQLVLFLSLVCPALLDPLARIGIKKKRSRFSYCNVRFGSQTTLLLHT